MRIVRPSLAAFRFLAGCVYLGCLSLLAGCASHPSPAPSSTATPNAPAITASSLDERLPIELLQKGLPAERVSALFGAPSELRPNSDQGIASEIWIYTRAVTGPMRQVAAETRDVPVVDPITGAMRTVPEPVYTNQRTYYTEKTELLMINGRLVAWKQRRTADSTEYQ